MAKIREQLTQLDKSIEEYKEKAIALRIEEAYRRGFHQALGMFSWLLPDCPEGEESRLLETAVKVAREMRSQRKEFRFYMHLADEEIRRRMGMPERKVRR